MSKLRVPSALWALTLSCVFAGCSARSLVPQWLSFSTPDPNSAEPVWETNWERAVAESQETQKTMLICLTGSDWCKYCMMLEQEVINTRRFVEWSQENVVLMLADFPRSWDLSPQTRAQNAELKERFAEQFRGYPTVIFVDTEQRVIGRLGYMPGGPENWIAAADEILHPAE